MTQLNDSDKKKVAEIVHRWKETGKALHKDREMARNKLPHNPGYVFRFDESWSGWNVYLNTPKDSEQFLIHEELDRLESIAFNQLQR
ncbi:MAG: hypothetical protein COA86_02275 [Kangiella sp.]|nr:MAG: hypothetical protein COA86_02275 [Kangiella sp.]